MTKFNTLFQGTEPFSDTAPQLALAANTALTYTVPGDSSKQYRVKFYWAYNANVWVAINSTAAVPLAGTITSDSRSVLRPEIKYARGGDVLSFISSQIVTDAGFELLELPS
jgi:hypothetical protein